MIARSPERDKWIAATERVGALARERAEASERQRYLADEVVAAMRREGLFAAFLPESLGGLGGDPLTLVELTECMASFDASAGWCLGTCGLIGGFAASRVPDAGAERFFGGEEATVIAGGYVPRCRAEAVPGGHRVSGRMSFASGCRHADAFVVTGIVEGVTGEAAMRSFLVPRGDVEVIDSWDVAGLEATGSHDLSLDAVFVTDAHSFAPVADPACRGEAVWRAPVLAYAAIPHLGFALGAARLALDEIRTHAARHRFGSATPIVDRGVFRRDYARAHTRLRAARLAAFDAFATVFEAEGAATLAQRADLSSAVAHAYATAAEISEFAFRAGGASALYRTHPLQRVFRDIQAGAQHIVAADEAFERAGAVYLGVGEPAFL